MKKVAIAALCIVVIFIFAQIYKHQRYVGMLYALQKIETQHALLLQEKNLLLTQLHTLTNPHALEERAKNMGMKKINLKSITQVNS